MEPGGKTKPQNIWQHQSRKQNKKTKMPDIFQRNLA